MINLQNANGPYEMPKDQGQMIRKRWYILDDECRAVQVKTFEHGARKAYAWSLDPNGEWEPWNGVLDTLGKGVEVDVILPSGDKVIRKR